MEQIKKYFNVQYELLLKYEKTYFNYYRIFFMLVRI